MAADVTRLILDAQRAGFGVFEEDGYWWVSVPSRKRRPASIQGAYGTSQRAWIGAAHIARSLPET